MFGSDPTGCTLNIVEMEGSIPDTFWTILTHFAVKSTFLIKKFNKSNPGYSKFLLLLKIILSSLYGGPEGTSHIANIFANICDVANIFANIFANISDVANIFANIFANISDVCKYLQCRKYLCKYLCKYLRCRKYLCKYLCKYFQCRKYLCKYICKYFRCLQIFAMSQISLQISLQIFAMSQISLQISLQIFAMSQILSHTLSHTLLHSLHICAGHFFKSLNKKKGLKVVWVPAFIPLTCTHGWVVGCSLGMIDYSSALSACALPWRYK